MRCECNEYPEPVVHDTVPFHERGQFRSIMIGKLALQPNENDNSRSRTCRETWYALVQEYTALRLTYQSDRLPAISGLAQMHQRCHREYICGLWRDDFVRGLLWRPFTYLAEYWKGHQRIRQQKYIAPTWSWASIHGSVRYLDSVDAEKMDTELVDVLDVDYTLASSNVFGAVTYASVTMSGTLLPVSLDADFSLRLNMNSSTSKVDVQTPLVPLKGKFVLDVETGDGAVHEIITQKELFLLILMTSSTEFTPIGIVLRATWEETDVPTFERIGFWQSRTLNEGHEPQREAIAEVAVEVME